MKNRNDCLIFNLKKFKINIYVYEIVLKDELMKSSKN